jgi:hypothetical protein
MLDCEVGFNMNYVNGIDERNLWVLESWNPETGDRIY